MIDGPDPEERRDPPPFPGDAFWRAVESAATTVGLGSPRNIFKIRKARARWEARREAERNIGRGVTYTHKACPACGRLVERAKAECPYCGANVRLWYRTGRSSRPVRWPRRIGARRIDSRRTGRTSRARHLNEGCGE